MPYRREGELAGLLRDAGLEDVEDGAIRVSAEYESFEDLWAPFTAGVGPAGAYAVSLPPTAGGSEGALSRAARGSRRPLQPHRARVVRDRPRVAGALLVGGASTRFGSPKALARFEGETLAERAHRVLAEAFDEVIVVGKAADELELPFEVLDDGSDVRASMVGLAAALRLAGTELVVVLPTDMPLVTRRSPARARGRGRGLRRRRPADRPAPGRLPPHGAACARAQDRLRRLRAPSGACRASDLRRRAGRGRAQERERAGRASRPVTPAAEAVYRQ